MTLSAMQRAAMQRAAKQQTDATTLRQDFDRTFAAPSVERRQSAAGLLGIRLGEAAYALETKAVSGLAQDRKIVALPSAAPAVLGVIGVRGVVVPVYDLARLIGEHEGGGQWRWFVLVNGDEPLAFAISAFDRYLQVAPDALLAAGPQKRTHIVGLARSDDGVRPIIDIASVIETINRGPAAKGS